MGAGNFYNMQNLNNHTVDANTAAMATAKIWQLLQEVCDPEIPVLSIIDLGIVRDVRIATPAETGTEKLEIVITPTYSGCPAMDAISMDIRLKLLEHGYKNFTIAQVLSPAWTTDWMTEAGRQKLQAYGIAPPRLNKPAADKLFAVPENIQCPLCKSYDTSLVSYFGSTACKALYKCLQCKEPFDHFKCH